MAPMPETKKADGNEPSASTAQLGAQGERHVMPEPSVTPMKPDELPRKVDAIREAVSNAPKIDWNALTRARIAPARRPIDVSDAAMRIAVGFARFLPPDSPLPTDEFLIDLATKVLDGYDGTTRTPRRVLR